MDDIPSEPYLAIKAVMMPRDTNPYGTIFGGVLLSYIDQAGAVGGAHEIRRRGWPQPNLVTVAMDKVEFHEPVFVGDTVSFVTCVSRIGRTSITVQVSVLAERQGKQTKLTQAEVTYVSINLSGDSREPASLRGDA